MFDYAQVFNNTLMDVATNVSYRLVWKATSYYECLTRIYLDQCNGLVPLKLAQLGT
jgi:hypothetical protein